MQTQELPLFSTLQTTPILIPRQEEIIHSTKKSHEPHPYATLTNTLNSLFPTQTQENKATKTRKALGQTAEAFSDEQVETIVTQFQFLIDSWLDEYERDVFKGLTLKEVINEK